MKSVKNGVNYNYPIPYEGRMAKTYLAQLEEDARTLRKALNDDDDMPGWVKLYIATAADRMNTAATYMQYEVANGPRSRSNPKRRRNPAITNPLLSQMLALRAAYQYAHWNADNYADHLLFERLYKSLDAGIDTLAEISNQIVEPVATPKISRLSLMRSEDRIIQMARQAVEKDRLDPGLENFLLGLIEERERAKYLLAQRSDKSANKRSPKGR